VKTTLTLFGAGLLSLVISGTVHAQEVATLVLQNGERPSGELVDLNASGFTLKIAGQDTQFAKSNVKAIEFVVGPLAPDAQAKVNAGQSVVILRSGQVVDGQLSDIGGTHPLRFTFNTSGGPRDFTSNDIYQVYLGGGAPQSVGTSGQAVAAPAPAPAAGAIAVPGNQPWTNTNIVVAPGDRVQFSASGEISVGTNLPSGVGGNPAATLPTGKYAVANAPVGALIGRVGNGRPFLIGGNTQTVSMPTGGALMLGVNDDNFGDNSGAFSVTVTTQTGQSGQPGRTRRR